MKRLLRQCVMVTLGVGAAWPAGRADELPVNLFDNFYLQTGLGLERQQGEDATGFGTFGANWTIPLAPPNPVALGVQLGGSAKLREDDAEWNATIGGLGRGFSTFDDRQGAAALLVDYRRTASHSDLWALRPILGTTISARDALSIEGVAGLNEKRRERINDSFTTFWTRGWSERLDTEFGAGYEFRRVRGAQFRVRAAIGLAPSVDLWCGADANLHGNY